MYKDTDIIFSKLNFKAAKSSQFEALAVQKLYYCLTKDHRLGRWQLIRNKVNPILNKSSNGSNPKKFSSKGYAQNYFLLLNLID